MKILNKEIAIDKADILFGMQALTISTTLVLNAVNLTEKAKSGAFGSLALKAEYKRHYYVLAALIILLIIGFVLYIKFKRSESESVGTSYEVVQSTDADNTTTVLLVPKKIL